MKTLSVLFIILSIAAKGQEFKKKNSYKSTFESGNEVIFKAKNLLIEDDNLSFNLVKSGAKNTEVNQQLSSLKKLEHATKTKALEGFIIGTGVGVIGAIIHDDLREQSRYPSYNTNNFQRWWQGKQGTVSGQAITMVTGSALLGLMIGKSFKKWETIYSNDMSSAEGRSLDLDIGFINKTNKPQILLSYQF
ncbi:MAG: hypothetical protein ABJ004_08905 [Cyclobacteriaceae bacterium]